MEKRKIRVLLSKLGLDGHDRGVVNVAMSLRDAGIEVIYLGRHMFPEDVAQAAIQEDVDIVGISSLADAHMTLMEQLVAALRSKGSDVPVILGGFIQPDDIPALKQMGVAEVFGIGTRMSDIVTYVENTAAAA
jgi:methylmalonyl-CoA mutase C-terminal domain/subunit